MRPSMVDRGDGWMDEAACAPPSVKTDTFFPEDGAGVVLARLNFCRVCPVAQECLNYALANRIEHGVWGGVSERQRRLMQSNPRMPRRPNTGPAEVRRSA